MSTSKYRLFSVLLETKRPMINPNDKLENLEKILCNGVYWIDEIYAQKKKIF